MDHDKKEKKDKCKKKKKERSASLEMNESAVEKEYVKRQRNVKWKLSVRILNMMLVAVEFRMIVHLKRK